MKRYKDNLKSVGINVGVLPVASINSALRKIGLKLKSEGPKREEGDVVRLYSLERLPSFTIDIVYTWFLNDTAKYCEEVDKLAVTDFLFKNREMLQFCSQPFLKPWPEAELNRRHEDFQSSALPTELSGLVV